MSPHLLIETPGLFTTVQDLGRFGRQDLGIPVSGALDTVALRLANALVANDLGTAGLEIRGTGPSIRVEADSIRIAVTGTGARIETLGESTELVSSWQSVRLMRGTVFRLRTMRDSATCYLAIEGGFDLPFLFDSQSTYVRGRIGGLDGRALRSGDRVPLRLADAPNRAEIGLPPPTAPSSNVIRIILGPQDTHFTAAGICTLLDAEYTISHQADRMGLRLDGPALEHAAGYNIISDGIATGAIQVPGTGQPIILLADHQTTGGYPKIATVASVELPLLGRMRPNETLRFQAISVAEAEEARRAQEDALHRLIASAEPVPSAPRLDSEALLATNLISGVVSVDE